MGWQSSHVNFAASYSRAVTGGGGLLGAFHSNSANGHVRWQMSRTWTIGAGANYAINKSATPFLLVGATQGGHSMTATATVSHTIHRQFSANFEYDRIHQSYEGIAAITSNPNSDREMISLSWQFTRPLGK
jgi:hypothetical protein